MNNFIDLYEFSQSIFGVVPEEYSIVYFIITMIFSIGMLLFMFCPFIFIGLLIKR